jgi:hypothetical protein
VTQSLISLEALEAAASDEKAKKRPLTERQKLLVDAVCNFQELRQADYERWKRETAKAKDKSEVKPRKRHRQLIAEAAGYPDTHSGRVMVYNDLGKSHVLQAISNRIRQKLTMGVVLASDSILELSTEARSEKVRLEAASKLLDMAGVGNTNSGGTGSGGLQVNINLGSGDDGVKTINATKDSSE